MSQTLNEAKMPSLKDKLREQEEARVEEPLEKEKVEDKQPKKRKAK